MYGIVALLFFAGITENERPYFAALSTRGSQKELL